MILLPHRYYLTTLIRPPEANRHSNSHEHFRICIPHGARILLLEPSRLESSRTELCVKEVEHNDIVKLRKGHKHSAIDARTFVMADLENPPKEDASQTMSASELIKPANPDLELEPPSILYQMFAEAIGSMFIVICGINAVNAAVIASGATGGNWQVGVMFALGITWGVYTAGPISGGHLNPAITAAITLLRPSTFPAWKLPCYWFAQYFGAWVGALFIYAIWSPSISAFETAEGITRGEPASDLTIAMYCGVAPFPAAAAEQPWLNAVTPGLAFFIEAFGAGVLCWVVFMTLDERNTTLKNKDFAPVLIGLSIGAMITVMSPLTTGSFNPARDGGPRVMASMFGWGRRAFPGFRNGFWLYFVGPITGAIVAGALYDFVFTRAYKGKRI